MLQLLDVPALGGWPASMGGQCKVVNDKLVKASDMVSECQMYMPRTRPPIFSMDFAKPATLRWKGAMALMAYTAKDTWEPIFYWHNRSLFDRLSPDIYPRLAKAVRTHYPEQAAELEGMVEEFRSVGMHVSFEYLAAWAYSHELGHIKKDEWAFAHGCDMANTQPRASCSALITQDAHGGIHHVALMDQVPYEIRKVVLQVRFMRGDELLFEGVDWYWFTTGVTRAVRKGLVALQENWRSVTPESDPAPMLQDIFSGAVPQAWVFRRLLTDPPLGYAQVVHQLSTMYLAAPYFVAVSGTRMDEGAVFARASASDPNGTVAGPDGIESLSDADGNWYLVQTNTDRWNPDNLFDPRRIYATAALEEAGRHRATSPLGLMEIGHVYPVLQQITAFSVYMSAKEGTMEAFINEPLIPVDFHAYSNLGAADMDPQLFFGSTCQRVQHWFPPPQDLHFDATKESLHETNWPLTQQLLAIGIVLVLVAVARFRRQRSQQSARRIA
jgi:N-acylethanolamine-hydrolysing acid amidase